MANLISVGFARIYASEGSRINCSAWLAAWDSMATLTVAKKDKQKGD